MLTSLRSDFVLSVHNADWYGSQQFLVTQLATQGNVHSRLLGKGIDPDQAIEWSREACRGTSLTHMAGLLHRDIKPENLFLSDRGTVMLGDFGLASLLGPAGICAGAGTPETTAPEVFLTGECTVKSDVYSLGATLFSMLAGCYAHDPGPGCMAAVTVGPGHPLRYVAPHVSRSLARVVEAAMHRDVARRLSSPDSLDAALGRVQVTDRRWTREDHHAPGHARCWLGRREGHQTVELCEFRMVHGLTSSRCIAEMAGGFLERAFKQSRMLRDQLLCASK